MSLRESVELNARVAALEERLAAAEAALAEVRKELWGASPPPQPGKKR